MGEHLFYRSLRSKRKKSYLLPFIFTEESIINCVGKHKQRPFLLTFTRGITSNLPTKEKITTGFSNLQENRHYKTQRVIVEVG